MLKHNKYKCIDNNDFYYFINNSESTKKFEEPIFTKQYEVGESLYGKKWKCDFILYHPNKHPKCLIIEAKWQQTKVSTDNNVSTPYKKH